jgi:antitoxin MazE
MQLVLRKLGNSTGMILPRAILGELGLEAGASLEVKVEGGDLVATPVTGAVRVGWAEAAAALGAPTAEEQEWIDFTNEGDASLTW